MVDQIFFIAECMELYRNIWTTTWQKLLNATCSWRCGEHLSVGTPCRDVQAPLHANFCHILTEKIVLSVFSVLQFFFGKRLFPQFPLPLSTFCSIYSYRKRSEQLSLPGWGSCTDLVKNRGALCSWCDLSKNDTILERTSYQKNMQHRVSRSSEWLSLLFSDIFLWY